MLGLVTGVVDVVWGWRQEMEGVASATGTTGGATYVGFGAETAALRCFLNSHSFFPTCWVGRAVTLKKSSSRPGRLEKYNRLSVTAVPLKKGSSTIRGWCEDSGLMNEMFN